MLDIDFINSQIIGHSKNSKKSWRMKKMVKEKAQITMKKYRNISTFNFSICNIRIIMQNLSRKELDNIFFNETIIV